MGIAEIFGFIYALLKAIPVLEKAVRGFIAFYAIKQKDWFYEELHKAVEKAVKTGETRDVENAIGSPRAGKPSGNDGSVFDDPDAP